MNLQPIVIQGVSFFDNPTACISDFESISWGKKVVSLIQSFGTLFTYILEKISQAFRSIHSQLAAHAKISTTDLVKQRLVVCVHGLNSSPSQFKNIYEKLLEKDVSETAIYIPHVLQKGNAKLDEMVKPIFDEIAAWASMPGEKELVFVGISNGGRISKAVTSEIAKSQDVANIKKLRFISIVGACKGSSLVNLANKVGLSWLMSKNISEEMPTDSACNQNLHQNWMDGLSSGPEQEYTFIASPHDCVVPNYDSTLMDVHGQKARYAIIPGHGHNSIVNAVADAVAEIVHAH